MIFILIFLNSKYVNEYSLNKVYILTNFEDNSVVIPYLSCQKCVQIFTRFINLTIVLLFGYEKNISIIIDLIYCTG